MTSLAGVTLASLAMTAVAALPAQAADKGPEKARTSTSAPAAAQAAQPGEMNALTVPIVTMHGEAPYKAAVESAIKSIDTGDRGTFVQQAVDKVFDAAGGQYNVMVFNLSQGYENGLSNIKLYANVKFGSVYYGVWIFSGGGTFKNTGDGGWINWGFKGWFNRNGGTVTF
ncbi:stress protein [Streptomyces sp. NPDC059247]|uniref:stress protein n=1 Tax=Streptomyces sp. NPDC059247 TaxID=3346790 RepID=UPI00368F446B